MARGMPGAHVDDLLTGQVCLGGKGQAVQQVQRGNLLLIGNGGEVHDLICLQKHPGEFKQGRDRLLSHAKGRKPLG